LFRIKITDFVTLTVTLQDYSRNFRHADAKEADFGRSW